MNQKLMVTGTVPTWTLGDRLRKARETVGMSQQAFAAEIGIARRSLARYEGDVIRPSRPVLVAWALATEVSLEWLLAPEVSEDVRHKGFEPLTHWLTADVRHSVMAAA